MNFITSPVSLLVAFYIVFYGLSLIYAFKTGLRLGLNQSAEPGEREEVKPTLMQRVTTFQSGRSGKIFGYKETKGRKLKAHDDEAAYLKEQEERLSSY